MAQRFFVGVDGGGTKTRAVVIDAAGNALGEGLAGSTNWNSVGLDKAKTELFSAINSALSTSSTDKKLVAGVCLGMSGVDRDEDKKQVAAWLHELFERDVQHNISNDGVVALASGTNGVLHGVVVISGTGTISLAFHKTHGEKQFRAAGWGPLLGDDGSGYSIGQDCLVAVTRAADGRGEKTALSEAVLQQLDLTAAMEIIPWTYKDVSWERIAGLAPVVYKTAREGDKIANAILDKAVNGILEALSAVITATGFKEEEEFPIVLAGGNLTHAGSLLAERLKQRLTAKYPKVKLVHPLVEPHHGAALLASNKYK